MSCPDCHTEMAQLTRQGVTIDRCQSCGGVWFDVEEIGEYVRRNRPVAPHTPADAHFTKHTRGAGARCPCCEEDALELGAIAGLGFQRCTWCGGIFLKEGDLERLIDPPRPVVATTGGREHLLEVIWGVIDPCSCETDRGCEEWPMLLGVEDSVR